MDTQIRRNKFVEYGDFKGYTYGVSIDSIKKEAASGRVCIVDLRGEVIIDTVFLYVTQLYRN